MAEALERDFAGVCKKSNRWGWCVALMISNSESRHVRMWSGSLLCYSSHSYNVLCIALLAHALRFLQTPFFGTNSRGLLVSWKSVGCFLRAVTQSFVYLTCFDTKIVFHFVISGHSSITPHVWALVGSRQREMQCCLKVSSHHRQSMNPVSVSIQK